jgi:uncharacterized protein (TIGR00725 family)
MGPGQCSEHGLDLAYQVGREIGRRGGILICGGRSGVMEAAAQGARETGAVTVGILPGRDAADANSYIDLPIVTDLGNARNVINVLTAQVIIAIQGGYGTLSEIGLALKVGTPVVGLETWNLQSPDGNLQTGIVAAETPEQAVTLAWTLLRK